MARIGLGDGNGASIAGGPDPDRASAGVPAPEAVPPIAEDVTSETFEDSGFSNVVLILHAPEESGPAIFELSGLPDHGAMVDFDENPISADTPYEARYYDDALGAWVLDLYFQPDADWSGDTGFEFTVTDGDGNALGTATASITVDPIADAPYFFPGVNEAPASDTPIVQVTATSPAEDGPVAVALPDGDTLMVWQSGLLPSSIKAQVYDSFGDPVGAAFNVTASGGANELQPSAAARSDGSFAISWIVDGAGTGGGDIRTAFYAAGATTPTATVTTVASAGLREADATVTAIDGGYVVTWAVDDGGGAATIMAQRYDPEGAEVGTPILAVGSANHGPGSGTSFDPPDHQVAALDNGDFVVVSGNGDAVSVVLVTGISANFVDFAGQPGADQPVVARTADGGFVVVWHQDDGLGNEDIYGRSYDSSGQALTAPLPLVTGPAAQFTPQVAGLPDGRYVVAWIGNNGVDGSYDVFTQIFRADGTPSYGGPVDISSTGTTGIGVPINETQPTITVHDDGTFTVGWLQNFATGSNNDVFFQNFDPGLGAVSAEPGEAMVLPTFGFLSDTDGSEHIVSLTLSGLPGGFTLDVGHRVDSGDPASDWVIDRTDPDASTFLDDFPAGPIILNTPGDYTGSATLQITMTSGEIADPAQTASVTVPVPITVEDIPNAAPVVDLDPYEPGNDGQATFVEGQGPAYLSYYATLDDDNISWDGATLTVAVTGGHAGEQLSIDSWGTGPGELLVDGSDLLYEGDVVGTISGGADGAPLVVTFNAEACHCAVELTIASILYDRTDDVTAAETRDISVTFVDGGGTDNGSQDTSVTHVALDVVPEANPLVLVPGPDAAGDEDQPIALTGISVSDADSDPSTGLLTIHLGVAHGTIDVRTDVAGGITAADITGGANGTAGLVITGTADQINATLAASGGLTYHGDPDYAGSDALTVGAWDGTAASPVQFSSLGELPLGAITAMQAGDLDGDGLGDFALGFDGGILVLANGIGAFPTPYGAPSAIVFADADGDGNNDVIFSIPGDGVTLNSGYVAWVSPGGVETIATGFAPGALAAGDLNGDGLTDILVVDRLSGQIAVILQDTPGTFLAPAFSGSLGLSAIGLATGDFDGDGNLDMLVTAWGGSVSLGLGNGHGGFAPLITEVNGMAAIPDLIAADFNGDGALDFAFTSAVTWGVTVTLNRGDGSFADPVSYETATNGEAVAVRAGDLNGDGVLDLVVTNDDAPGTVSILTGNGDGSFVAPVNVDTGDHPGLIGIADPDGDGDLDFIVVNDGGAEAFNNDAAGRGTTAIKPIEVGAVNDAPVLGDPTAATVRGPTAVGTPVALMAGVTLSDAEAAAGFVGGSVTISVSGTGGYLALDLGDDFGTVGGLTDSAGHVLGTLSGSGTGTITVSDLTSYATADVLETLFAAFRFVTDAPLAAGTRTVTLTFDDGGNGGGTGLEDQVSQALNIPYHTVRGTGADETLVGTDWSDTILGLAGNDHIDGGPGSDLLRGGAGDDTYQVDNVADQVWEVANEGYDVVEASVSFSLASQYIEELILTGSDDLTGRGNGLANLMVGNQGVNQLYGGKGDDTYVVQNVGDKVFEKNGEGTDTVESTVSFSMIGQYIENLILSGSGALRGDGNSLANHITGGDGDDYLRGLDGDDVLDGAAGADIMRGGAGDDHYVIDNVNDRVNEIANEGYDTAEASVSFSLASQYVEDLLLTGAGAIDGTGNGLDNALTGNDGANRLRGMDGADTLAGAGGDDRLEGGAGSDMLTGGAGSDSFVFGTTLGASNVDAITDFEAGTDHILLARSIFGMAAGPLSAGAFAIGAAAQDPGDRIIYDPGTGWLWFDSDGNRAGAPVHFATLDTGLALTASDFTLF